jgi:hypothetical protein
MANGPEFFQTIMGRTFFEGTMPRLVKQLEKLNENLEKANADAVVTNFEGTLFDDALDHFNHTEERPFFIRAMLDYLSDDELRAELKEREGDAPKSVTVRPGDTVVFEQVTVLGDKLDPKELANTSQSMQPVTFSLTQEEKEHDPEEVLLSLGGNAFRRAQATLEEMRLKMESDNAKKWVVLCKRTEDPKLGWLERTLDGHGIPNRRNGRSFHGPILEVREDFEDRAQRILALVDHMEDDDVIFGGTTGPLKER